ncbi:MAG: ANTAR domain-containing protein [bacterium]|nr:ANTAR domain-containing protein [bacterium]
MTKESMDSLKRKLKKKDAELKILHQITDTISYNLNLDEVLKEVVSIVSDTMKADSCLIYLTSDHSIILKASKIPHPNMINSVIMHLDEGITGWVAKHRKTVIIEKEAYLDNRFKTVSRLSEDKWESFVSVPIIHQDKLVGVINIQNKKSKKYQKDQIKLLSTIASQVGGAISNAQLISETRVLKEALKTRKVVEKAKGLLMKSNNISENEAYEMIRRKSMNSKKTMKEIAEAIILTLNIV